MRKLLKGFLPWTALGGCLLLLTCACVLAPTAPDQGKGYTYAINNHGAIHYVTPFVYYMVFLYVPLMLIAAALIKRWAQRSG
jgi:hypothetical protein